MFRDHFSRHAAGYAAFRPGYPDALFRWLAAHTARHDLALDCATGNGQAAIGLAEHYARVVAIDASPEQIGQAAPAPGIEYRVAAAEDTGLPAESVDLVTVAQALHWLNVPAFFEEAARVLVPGGLVAAWGYALPRVNAGVDEVVDDFYTRIAGPWWPPERRMVDEEYANVAFPFEELACPRFVIERALDLEELVGYIGTWSAVRRLREESGRDPIIELRGRLLGPWGDPSRPRAVRWPVFMRAGRPRRGLNTIAEPA